MFSCCTGAVQGDLVKKWAQDLWKQVWQQQLKMSVIQRETVGHYEGFRPKILHLAGRNAFSTRVLSFFRTNQLAIRLHSYQKSNDLPVADVCVCTKCGRELSSATMLTNHLLCSCPAPDLQAARLNLAAQCSRFTDDHPDPKRGLEQVWHEFSLRHHNWSRNIYRFLLCLDHYRKLDVTLVHACSRYLNSVFCACVKSFDGLSAVYL